MRYPLPLFAHLIYECSLTEPFLTQYLIEPKWVNITLDQAYQDVYPVWTYSYLAVLVVVFLLTDYVKYTPMIVFEGLALVATWLLLVFASGVRYMQVNFYDLKKTIN